MASGFCVRVLLLSLFVFGKHGNGLSYKPAAAPASRGSPAQPGGPVGSSGPSYAGSASSEYQNPAFSSGCVRQVDGYSPAGCASSYRAGLPLHQTPPQPHIQPKSKADGVIQTKAGMWDFALPQQSSQQPRAPQKPGYRRKPGSRRRLVYPYRPPQKLGDLPRRGHRRRPPQKSGDRPRWGYQRRPPQKSGDRPRGGYQRRPPQG